MTPAELLRLAQAAELDAIKARIDALRTPQQPELLTKADERLEQARSAQKELRKEQP